MLGLDLRQLSALEIEHDLALVHGFDVFDAFALDVAPAHAGCLPSARAAESLTTIQPGWTITTSFQATALSGAVPADDDRHRDAGSVPVESELDVVDAPPVLAVVVYSRMVEHGQCDVPLRHQPCPMFVSMSSGTAVSDSTKITTR